ncbi:MAG: hypothetical protein J1F12_03960 [Muribaculaceae bacterium]|nr:hypothetical protein [Muribaculaceae bacterium]
MLSYSVAIRTLATSSYLKEELEALCNQYISPQKIIVYLPEDTLSPDFKIADEQYIHVKKGMMHQRLLPYSDISSDCILMLDDDVDLQSDSVEKLLKAMEDNNADLVAADTFQNHNLTFASKIKAVITNLVFPHFSKKWAFKIHKNGSFSYINKPSENYYPSQSCAGNAMLWKTDSYRKLNMQDELWLDFLPFAFQDDMLESYKVYKNGLKLGVVFNSGIQHLDSKSASESFKKSTDYIKNRTIAQLAIWWRTCYNPGNSGFLSRLFAASAFSFKMTWLFFVLLSYSIVKLDFSYCSNFLKGLSDGWKFVHSKSFRSLPPYVVK